MAITLPQDPLTAPGLANQQALDNRQRQDTANLQAQRNQNRLNHNYRRALRSNSSSAILAATRALGGTGGADTEALRQVALGGSGIANATQMESDARNMTDKQQGIIQRMTAQPTNPAISQTKGTARPSTGGKELESSVGQWGTGAISPLKPAVPLVSGSASSDNNPYRGFSSKAAMDSSGVSSSSPGTISNVGSSVPTPVDPLTAAVAPPPTHDQVSASQTAINGMVDTRAKFAHDLLGSDLIKSGDSEALGRAYKRGKDTHNLSEDQINEFLSGNGISFENKPSLAAQKANSGDEAANQEEQNASLEHAKFEDAQHQFEQSSNDKELYANDELNKKNNVEYDQQMSQRDQKLVFDREQATEQRRIDNEKLGRLATGDPMGESLESQVSKIKAIQKAYAIQDTRSRVESTKPFVYVPADVESSDDENDGTFTNLGRGIARMFTGSYDEEYVRDTQFKIQMDAQAHKFAMQKLNQLTSDMALTPLVQTPSKNSSSVNTTSNQ